MLDAWVADDPAREVAYNLLTAAVLEIRAATEPGRADPDSERHRANVLAHLVHNWPTELKDMEPNGDYKALLRRWWLERDKRSDPWLRERMEFLAGGVRSPSADVPTGAGSGREPERTFVLPFDFHQPLPELIGLTEAQAREWADRHQLRVRVLADGGVMTLDLTNGRVNLVLVDGVVTKATIF